MLGSLEHRQFVVCPHLDYYAEKYYAGSIQVKTDEETVRDFLLNSLFMHKTF